MSRSRGGRLRVALLLWLLAAPGWAVGPLVTGHVVDADGAPVAGALVTVHEEGDRRPLGSTYTAADGRFALSAPSGSGSFVAVATAGERTARRTFTRGPGAPSSYFELVLAGETPLLRRALAFAGDKADAFLGTVLGLIAGVYLRRWEERHKARTTLQMRRDALGGSVGRAQATLKCLVDQEHETNPAAITTQGYARIWEGVGAKLDDLAREREKLVSVEGLVVPAMGWGSIKHYGKLQEKLRSIEEMRTAGRLDRERLNLLGTALKELQSHKFLKD